ncbi:hypothetical protein TWF569_000217 [Orbilia oligospora]|nr:hypothetical protein TWF569_000217 [Orbilia oligospora]
MFNLNSILKLRLSHKRDADRCPHASKFKLKLQGQHHVHSCNLNGVHTEAKKEAFEFARLFDSDTLTVIVGDEQRKFNIHLGAVCSVSTYFKKLISSNMKEAQEKVLTLNDEVDDADAFDMFVQYCYLKSYIVDEELYLDSLYLHARVYVLAERLGCIDLKTLALKRATELCYGSRNENLKTGEILRNLTQKILTVYTHTYDSNMGKLPFTKNEEADEESKETVRRDGFRLLLASFAAPHLSQLRKDGIFLDANNLCPNFAADLLIFVTSGAKMEVNEDGSLKCPSL